MPHHPWRHRRYVCLTSRPSPRPPLQGIRTLTNEEAARLIGDDRETHQRDLFDAIERGDFPRWRVMIQVMPETEAERTTYNPFDLTKVWPHRDYPMIEVGNLELNRTPESYFAEIEEAAFSPANVVPGISHSPDKMLQFRIFAYADTHRHRLGVNYESLPVNRPQCLVHTYHRDGAMRFDDNGGRTVNDEPNSFGGPVEDARFKEPPLRISGDADRYDSRTAADDFIEHFAKADSSYAEGVAAGAGGQGLRPPAPGPLSGRRHGPRL